MLINALYYFDNCKHLIHYIRLFCLTLLLVWASNEVQSQELWDQKIQFHVEEVNPAKIQKNNQKAATQQPKIATIKPNTVWQLSGTNSSHEARLIIIEIGEHKAIYGNRINQERGVLPGTFSIWFYPNAYKTSKGSPLTFTEDTRVKIFTLDKDLAIQEFSFKQVKTDKLDALYAFDLGPEGQTVWQGFDAMTPSHPLLIHSKKVSKNKLASFNRLSLDPLIRDGISGIRSLKLPLSKGQWRLHLWTEDVGYWQTLPEQIERRIRINGEDREYQLNPPWQWVKNRYTQNKFRLSQFSQLSNLTSWRAIGQYRGDYKTFDVEAHNDELLIELAGANKMATTITAFMIERQDQHLLSEVNFNRAQWFNGRWPLLAYPKEHKQSTVNISKNQTFNITYNNPLFISLPFKKGLSLKDVDWLNTPLIVEKRLSLPQLERNLGSYQANPAGSFLAIKPLLITAVQNTPKHNSELHLMITVPASLAAGTYPIKLINKHDKTVLHQLSIQLLDVALPDLKKPVGVYLDLAPHLFLSYERKTKADKQLLCDLETLSGLTLTGVAPPFPLPKSNKLQTDYQTRLTHLMTLGFKPPFLDYAGLKNLRYQFGQDQTSHMLQQLSKTISTPQSLAISIADEPSNVSSKGLGLIQMAKLVDNSQAIFKQKKIAPLLKAAHLNNPKDRQWLLELDIALINHGYGVSRKSIQKIRNKEVQVWLYNMNNKRLAAGFFLWKHKLSGYLQWHARMPTADPFDPTDGREDDQQLLPVMSKLCAKVADLHPEIIAIAEGVTDHRWLNWLDQKSQDSVAAFKLRQQLLSQVPNTWKRAENLTSEQLQTWRNQIEELALSIPKSN